MNTNKVQYRKDYNILEKDETVAESTLAFVACGSLLFVVSIIVSIL